MWPELTVDVDSRSLVVRELDPADEDAVLRIFAASEDWFVAATGTPPAPGDVQSLYYVVPEGAAFEDKRILVVTDRGEIIGVIDCVLRHPGEHDCAVGLFLLNPDDRGFGVGTAVARALLARARSAGVARVTAPPSQSWPAGRRFLDRLGFTVPAADATSGGDGRTTVRAELRLD